MSFAAMHFVTPRTIAAATKTSVKPKTERTIQHNARKLLQNTTMPKTERTIQHWAKIGKLPQPLPVKNRTIWPVQTIRDWLIVNMPDADLTVLEGV